MVSSPYMEKEENPKAVLTKDDLSDTLNEFFGKVIEPRFDKIDKKLEEHDRRFNDLLNHFDQIYHRLDRLETEYFTITAGLQRIEKQLNAVEEKLDKEISLNNPFCHAGTAYAEAASCKHT